jgi:PAS domain S-box-containing protein
LLEVFSTTSSFIAPNYNLWLVGVSIAIAIATSYTALDLAARIAHEQGRAKWDWLIGGALVMGLGVWTMHFVGMLAVHFPFRIGFDLTLTLVSMLPAILAAALALYVLQRPNIGWRPLALGGTAMGAGIGAMHYTGMAAMKMTPPVRYDPLLFALSVAFAAGAAMLALRFAAKQNAARGDNAQWHKTFGAVVMGVAIAGMHYLGMSAARFAPGSVCVSGLLEPAMASSYNPWLVTLSVAIAIFASYTSLDLAARTSAAEGRAKWTWLCGGAIAMGLGIWSMHFVAMLAYKLPTPLGYDLTITLLSIVPAILAAGFALFVIQRGQVNPRILGLSGLVMGAGIGAMHYGGMEAMKMSPPIRYDATFFALSILFAVAAAVTALWVAFKHRLADTSTGHAAWRKFGSASIMGATIAGMHYTGMTATHFTPGSLCLTNLGGIDSNWLAVFVGGGTSFVLLLAYIVAFFDEQLAQLRARVIKRLTTTNEDLNSRANELALAMTAELRSSSAQRRLFATVVAHSTEAIITTDLAGKVTSWNAAAARMFGYTAEDMIGSDPALLQPLGQELFSAHAMSDATPTFLSGDLSTRDQRVLHVSMSRSTLRDPEGAALGEISIVRDVTEQRTAQEALRESNTKLRELSEHLQRAREQERIRIARELHDELGSTLTAAGLYLSRAGKPDGVSPTNGTDPLAKARELLETAVQTTRRITTDLRPSVLDHRGLWPAIDWLAKEIAGSGVIKCDVSISDQVRNLKITDELASAMFRIVQEALNNVVRHARASDVHIGVQLIDSVLALEIRDNGIGRTESQTKKSESWGILGMQERARALGGELCLTGMPGQGTLLSARFPALTEELNA